MSSDELQMIGWLDLETSEWFQRLVEDVEAIYTEYKYNAQQVLIAGYHAIGTRILEERSNFNKLGVKHPQQMLELVSKALGKSDRTLRYAVKFVDKHPDLNAYLEKQGKNVSWRGIITNELTNHKDDEVKSLRKYPSVEEIRIRLISEISALRSKMEGKTANGGFRVALSILERLYEDLWGEI